MNIAGDVPTMLKPDSSAEFPKAQLISGIRVYDLGLTFFDEALRIQEGLLEDVSRGAPSALMLVEHPPVITLGRSADPKNLLLSESQAAAQNISIYTTKRGGDVTCHFPGQLVVYPIWNIEKRPGGLKGFVRDLEESVLTLLRKYDVEGRRREGMPGVWTKEGKVASIGIAVRRWVTYHGLSINIGSDLGLFRHINPCGTAGLSVSSLHHELPPGLQPSMHKVKHDYTNIFLKIFAHTQVAAGKAAG
jgi:lipoyl(octanoyl) transferase